MSTTILETVLLEKFCPAYTGERRLLFTGDHFPRSPMNFKCVGVVKTGNIAVVNFRTFDRSDIRRDICDYVLGEGRDKVVVVESSRGHYLMDRESAYQLRDLVGPLS